MPLHSGPPSPVCLFSGSRTRTLLLAFRQGAVNGHHLAPGGVRLVPRLSPLPIHASTELNAPFPYPSLASGSAGSENQDASLAQADHFRSSKVLPPTPFLFLACQGQNHHPPLCSQSKKESTAGIPNDDHRLSPGGSWNLQKPLLLRPSMCFPVPLRMYCVLHITLLPPPLPPVNTVNTNQGRVGRRGHVG